ncbi:Cytochrome P450 [Dillenia turbinata]|uniref:Cytochrome P450 n=1 Tax=Dillenia turbinata TaxID=194707 RepID=A0AAN8UXH8_9MAGN
MTSEYYSLFISADEFPFLNFSLSTLAFLFISLLAFFLSPGGLAWALSYTRFPLQHKTAIPGPTGFPLAGLLFAFTGSLTHRVLGKLAKAFKAESLMAFSVGLTRFVISSQPKSAKEILNSSAFADRPIKESAYMLLFHRAMGFAPFGEYWRNLRRISATYMLSPRQIAELGEFRRVLGLKMVEQIKGLMEKESGEFEVKSILHFGSLNNVMMSVFGKCYDFESVDGVELESLVSEGYELLGIFNWSDHFPILGWFDLQGVRKRCRKLVSRVNVFVGKIIEEHRVNKLENNGVVLEGRCEGRCGDFVDVLLGLEGEERLSDSDMIAVLWVIFPLH